jgi:DNA polymerase-3 subunit gamma/tau
MGELWLLWKSEEDAIAWAATQLPEMSAEQLRQEFDKLSPSNGKKAPAWVAQITELKEQF